MFKEFKYQIKEKKVHERMLTKCIKQLHSLLFKNKLPLIDNSKF